MYQEPDVTFLKGSIKGVDPVTHGFNIETESVGNSHLLEKLKTRDCTCVFSTTEELNKLHEEYMEKLEVISEELFDYVNEQYQVFREEWLIPRLEHFLEVFKETFNYQTESLAYLNGSSDDIDIELDDTKRYTASFEFMIKELKKDAIDYIYGLKENSDKYKEFLAVEEEHSKVCSPRYCIPEAFRAKIERKIYKDIKRLCKVYRIKMRTHVIEFK